MNKAMIFETTFKSYTSIKILGQGGAGSVYEVEDEDQNRYALKLLTNSNTEKRKRFKNELFFSLKNQHPNIITVIDHGLFKDGKREDPFYVMPSYDKSLRTLMVEGIKLEKILLYYDQLLSGVDAAHKLGVIHRDLKPENILYDSNSDRLLLADFGTARFSEDFLYTSVETAPGTRLANFQYAAPEQRIKGGQVGSEADIFALGLILNELFTGEVPQGTNYKTISSIDSQYGYLDELVAKLICQNPKDRPKSVEEIKKILIGRKNEFVSLQRLSELNKQVIPTTNIVDSIIQDPPRLVGIDWKENTLYLALSSSVNSGWISALYNIENYECYYGRGPKTVKINGNIASINAFQNEVQRTVDFFPLVQ